MRYIKHTFFVSHLPFHDSFSEKLKFRPPPVNKKLELGSVTKIHCKAEGDGQSDPIVHWLKEGKLVLPAHVDDVQGTLMFKEVTRADAGTYTCVASSNQGVINKTISVAVVGESTIQLSNKHMGQNFKMCTNR